MIDLTPLDVRNKRGDFKKLMRGYDPQEVDTFLEIIAERLEALTRENMALRERTQTLQEQVSSQATREQAVQEALVTAQELRTDIRNQSQREADHVLREAETEGRRLIAEAEAEARTKVRAAERKIDQLADSIQEVERRRARFLKDFRQLLERELDVVDVEEDRSPLEERPIDLELGGRQPESVPERPALPELTPPPVSPAVEPAGPVTEPVAPEVELEAMSETAVPVLDVDAPPEVVPPADAPIDQLAAAYQQSVDGGEAPPPPERRHDNLLLYLDSDEEETGA